MDNWLIKRKPDSIEKKKWTRVTPGITPKKEIERYNEGINHLQTTNGNRTPIDCSSQ